MLTEHRKHVELHLKTICPTASEECKYIQLEMPIFLM